MNARIYLLPFLFIALFTTCTLAQGPISGFQPPKSGTDMALSASYETFEDYFFGKERRTADLVNAQSVNLFLEHAFEDSISLVLNIPYIQIDTENSGFQDGSIFLKYRNKHIQYTSGRLSFITAVGLSLPLSNYPVDTETPIGIQASLLQGRFLAQYVANNGIFFQLQSGLDFRVAPSNQTALPVLFRTGFGSRKFFLEAWAEIFHTFKSLTVDQLIAGEGSRWFRLGASIFYNFNPYFGIFVGGAQVLDGRNIGLATRFNLGMAYKLRNK